MFKKIILTVGSLLIMTSADGANAASPENTLYMEVSSGGTVTLELKPDLAPKHVERIKKLTSEGFYDGVIFHRVIDGFMAQTGDPTGTGTGGSDYADLPAEFTDTNFGRGTVGMARAASPDSANSQFFICFDNCSFLNGQYTVFAEVTDGMDLIDKVAKGEPPANPDKIVSMKTGDSKEESPAPAEVKEEAPAETEEPVEAEAASEEATEEASEDHAADSDEPEAAQASH